MDTEHSPRSQVRQHRERGAYDRATIDAILDEALICHLGFVMDGQPYVIPTIHARVGDNLYMHGSTTSRMLRALAGGLPCCLAATLLDGLVLARSGFNHSMNYRSVVILGTAAEVTDTDEKLRALDAVIEHVARGRAADVRPATAGEIKATSVLRLPISEASAKVRSGPPKDDEEDLDLPIWVGVIPLATTAGAPVASPDMPAGIPVPPYAKDYKRG